MGDRTLVSRIVELRFPQYERVIVPSGSCGGMLKLLNLPAKVSDILQITQLITVFEVYDDEDEAVGSF